MESLVVKSAAQQLGNLMVEEAKYLYDVKDKIESLQRELVWMEGFLRDVDTQQHKDAVLRIWVSDVQDLAYDAEDIIEKYLHGVPHHRQGGIENTLKWFSCILCTCDAWKLHNLGSEIDNLTVKLSELTSRLQRYRPSGGSIRSLEYNKTLIWEERRAYPHTEEDVVGLKKDIEQVVDQLVRSTQVKVVVISGVGGLGKTTLARKVFKHKDIKDHFGENCTWVYISKEFDIKTIFQEILRQLGRGNDANRTKEQSVEEIHKVLQEKRCFVVIDDIWDVKAWERLKPAFESIFTTASSSSKILFTTRNQGLLQHVDRSGYLHLLRHLNDDDSWKLLKRKAFIGDGTTDDDHKERLGKEMLKHCDGIPLAIVTIGGVLSTKKALSEWEDVRINISSYLTSRMEAEIINNRLMEILELSYNELPYYLKPCFLYLGHFPEDYEISTQKLYHLWEAEGFFVLEDDVQKRGGTSYDIGERYLNELVQRSMVLVRKCRENGRIKTCQVHDVIRDMCLKKCEEVGFLSHFACTESGMVYGLPPTETKKLRRCALICEDEGDGDWHLGEKAAWQFGENVAGLRCLLVFENLSLGRKIWKSCPLLRVLDLQNVEFKSIDGMKCLIHLRYLSLRRSGHIKIPSWLFDLQYIETLDLRCYLYLRHTPLSDKFYKMKRLRHLYLPGDFTVRGGGKLRFPSGGQMETIKNFDPSRCEAKELMQMTNLRVFSIRKDYNIWGTAEDMKWVLDSPVMKTTGQLINTFPCINGIKEDVIKENPLILSSFARHFNNFEELKIQGAEGKHVEKKGHSIIFWNSLKKVVLEKCDTSDEGGLLLDLEKLPRLETLSLQGSMIREAMNKMSFSPHSFPRLTHFCVEFPNRSFEWEVWEAAAPNLQQLELEKCENLNKFKNIPNSLIRVKLRDCVITEGEVSALGKLPCLENLNVQGGLVKIKSLNFSSGSFPRLYVLMLKDQTELEEWEVGEGTLPNLQRLELEGLRKLKKVVMNELPRSLTHVGLEDCDIFGEGGHLSLLGYLEKLPQLRILRMDKLVRSDAGVGGNKLSFGPGTFLQLAELYLTLHPEREEWEVRDGALPNLQRLTLHDLKRQNKLNKLPDSLIQVDLFGCEIREAAEDVLLSALENLPRLQQLPLWRPEIGGGKKLSLSPGSFLHLTKLYIRFANELEELKVGDGALPNLKNFELHRCSKLKKLPEGLPKSVDIECFKPCINGIEKYNTCPRFIKKQKTIEGKVVAS